jgi:hypothetical protein
MDLREYQHHVELLAYGKKLPTAVYVYRDTATSLGEAIDRLLSQVTVAFQIGPEFNLIKFRTHALKLSFLAYPDFFEDPHPSLRQAITIDLVRGKARHTDYGVNLNPPILHRKEAFLTPDHPRRAEIVNLGYVVDVIEDPAERLEALVDAFRLTRRILVVSALINQTVQVETADRLHDGAVTKRNTFQKYFEQQELQQYLEDALETGAVPVGLGIFGKTAGVDGSVNRPRS